MAVVCVTHRSGALLEGYVSALRAASVSPGVRLVMVDSGSPDDTPERAARLAPNADNVRLAENRGYSAGINAGIAHVRATGGADVFVIANPDMRPDPGSLDALVAGLKEHGAGITCPRLVDQSGTLQPSLRRMPTVGAVWAEAFLGGPRAEGVGLPAEVVRDASAYTRAHCVGWATGGLLAVSDECSAAVGRWNEGYFLYEEEVDFCERAGQAGYPTWYIPGASAMRLGGDDDVAPWRQALMRRNRVRRMGEGHPVQGMIVAAALVTGDLMRAALGRREARAGLWSVLTRATPESIMRRYAPGSAPVVAAKGAPASTGEVLRSAVGTSE